MTDLSKGIIDVFGFEITRNTQPNEIEVALGDKIDANLCNKSKTVQGIYFKNVSILDRMYNLDVSFWDGKLKSIKLVCTSETYPSYEERFSADCKWFKSVLGEPTEEGKYGIVYEFEFVHVGASWWESDGRSGPDEYISISY